MFLDNEERRRKAFQVNNALVAELLCNEAYLILIFSQRLRIMRFQSATALRDTEARTVRIGPWGQLQQSICTKCGQLITKIERKGTMLIQYIGELGWHVAKLLEKIHGLLNVRFTAPAAVFFQFIQKFQNDETCVSGFPLFPLPFERNNAFPVGRQPTIGITAQLRIYKHIVKRRYRQLFQYLGLGQRRYDSPVSR